MGAMEALVPHTSVLVETTPDTWDGQLLPEEARAVRNAGAPRRREFGAGRWCAQRALARLGVTGFPVVPGAHREPIWPGGIVGSITHCAGYCAAVLTRAGELAGLGIDAEVNQAIEPSIATAICGPDELTDLPRLIGIDPPLIAFSAKESVFKLWFPLMGRMLWHHDLAVRLDPKTGTFAAELVSPASSAAERLLDRVEGRFAWDNTHVFTVASLLPDHRWGDRRGAM